MGEEVRIWEITGDDALKELPRRQLDLEERLEDWIEGDISILSDDLLVIGRQVPTDFGHSIDLLCIDPKGDVTIVELKRHLTPRDVTAQGLDYASWVQDLSNERVRDIADAHLGDRGPLDAAFKRAFSDELPDVLNSDHRILIVASYIDDSTMRIVNYLSERGVGINYVTFQYFQEGQRELVARVFLIDPAKVEHRSERSGTSKRLPNLTYDELHNIAEEKGLGDLYDRMVERLRPLFNQTGTTRSSIAFKCRMPEGGMHVVFSLIPVDSDPERGLKFQLYSTRLTLLVDVRKEDFKSMLPEDTHDWAYSGDEDPYYKGYEGFFKGEEEFEGLIEVLGRITSH